MSPPGVPPPPPPPEPPGPNVPDPFAPAPPAPAPAPVIRHPTPSFVAELEKTQRQRWMDRAKAFGSVIASLLAGGGVVYEIAVTRVQNQIDESVEQHTHAPFNEAHERASQKLDRLEKATDALTAQMGPVVKKVEEQYKALYEIYRFNAGEKAADLESNRKLKAKARDRAYTRFENYVRNGESLDDAYRKAIGGPNFF